MLDQAADKLKLGVRCGRKSDLDLPKAELTQKLEKFQLFLKVHRHDQCLIAVAQIDAAPARSLVNVLPFAPAAVGDRRIKIVAGIFLNVFHSKTSFRRDKKGLSSLNISETKDLNFRGTTLIHTV